MDALPMQKIVVTSAKNTWVQPLTIENVLHVEYTLKGIILITANPDTKQIDGFQTFNSLEWSWRYEVLENV